MKNVYLRNKKGEWQLYKRVTNKQLKERNIAIGEWAYIGKEANIGIVEEAYIGEGAYIGEWAYIGKEANIEERKG